VLAVLTLGVLVSYTQVTTFLLLSVNSLIDKLFGWLSQNDHSLNLDRKRAKLLGMINQPPLDHPYQSHFP
jgi:hypothetical protein